MNFECRVQHLELQYESLDGTVRKILAYTKNTHDILMTHVADSSMKFEQLEKGQTELFKRIDRLESDSTEIKGMLKRLVAKVGA